MSAHDRLASLLADFPAGLYIDGHWRPTADMFDVENPSTGNVLAAVAQATSDEGLAALDAADRAADAWAKTPPRERSDYLRALFDRVKERAEDFAVCISAEMGKPLSEARTEVAYGAEFLRWYAEEAVRLPGSYGSSPEGHLRTLTRSIPVGPTLAITPWNFPLAMATRKLAPALAAGCTMVLKPAELAPLTSLLLMQVIDDVGLPAGVLNCVTTTNPQAVTGPLLRDRRLRKVSFTGSTAVGQDLMRASAERVLRLSLELGGNAPFIVLPHADLERALDAAVVAKMRNVGQACTSANRFYVHHELAEEFARGLADRLRALTVGDSLDPQTEVGPMISASARAKAMHKVDEELAGGAMMLCGGRSEDPGYFLEPTVVINPQLWGPLTSAEIFAPIAPVVPYSSTASAVAMANHGDHGLISYVMGEHLDHTLAVAESLTSGMVAVNAGVISNAALPFGGTKMSGLGREGAAAGLGEYLETQYIGMGIPG